MPDANPWLTRAPRPPIAVAPWERELDEALTVLITYRAPLTSDAAQHDYLKRGRPLIVAGRVAAAMVAVVALALTGGASDGRGRKTSG